MLTAQQLEEGDSELSGRLGDGGGKWQLFVSSSAPIQIMNLLQTRSGHLSNLSTTPAPCFPGSGSRPAFGTASITDRTDRIGVAISLTLPAAAGGDGALTYTLVPTVPGLSFNVSSRQLTGVPTRAGTYRMTYHVTDADADTSTCDADTRVFTITVPAEDFTPADQSAFNALVVGKKVRFGFFSVGFLTRNRFDGENRLQGTTFTGHYTYEKTETTDGELGVLGMYLNSGSFFSGPSPHVCNFILLFTSPTLGQFQFTCPGHGGSGATFEVLG